MIFRFSLNDRKTNGHGNVGKRFEKTSHQLKVQITGNIQAFGVKRVCEAPLSGRSEKALTGRGGSSDPEEYRRGGLWGRDHFTTDRRRPRGAKRSDAV